MSSMENNIDEMAWRIVDHRRELQVVVVFRNGSTATLKHQLNRTITYSDAKAIADKLVGEAWAATDDKPASDLTGAP